MRLIRRRRTMLERYAAEHTHPANRVAHIVGLPLLFAGAGALAVKPRLGAGLLAVGTAIQLVGHRYEGRPPAFVNDRKMLVAGPFLGARWWVREVLGR